MSNTAALADDRGGQLRAGVVRHVGLAALAVVIIGFLAGMGYIASDQAGLAIGVAAACAVLVIASTDPLAAGTIAVLGVWIIQRVSGGGVDLSGSDALLALGTMACLPFVPWQRAAVHRVLMAVLAFEAILIVTVVAHPTAPAAFELVHRLFLTGGAVVIGAALAGQRRHKDALRALLVIATVISLLAVITAIQQGFEPGPTLGLHKNFVGAMAAMAVLLMRVAPSATGLTGPQRVGAECSCLVGLLASQSRGAVFALLAGVITAQLVSRRQLRQSLPFLLVLAVGGTFALLSARADVERADTATSSYTERTRFSDEAVDAWRDSPLVGQGMRFFTSGEFALDSDPHNVVVASLSETGVVGLAALCGLLLATGSTLRRSRTPLAMAALAILVARVVHGTFDVYWVASTQTLPWLIVGMAVGEPVAEAAGDG